MSIGMVLAWPVMACLIIGAFIVANRVAARIGFDDPSHSQRSDFGYILNWLYLILLVPAGLAFVGLWLLLSPFIGLFYVMSWAVRFWSDVQEEEARNA